MDGVSRRAEQGSRASDNLYERVDQFKIVDDENANLEESV